MNVQTMVFGNKGDTSGTGVAFTRNAATGENEWYGDYLINAPGGGDRDMGDTEFTIEQGKLYVLQTRVGKLHPRFDAMADVKVLATWLNTSPGAAVGKVVFDADKAEEMGEHGEKGILTLWETTPDDLHGMIAAQGIWTGHGGKTSHAAVVARGLGKPCVAGCAVLEIDTENRMCSVDGTTLREGDVRGIDGTTGRVVVGPVPLVSPTPTPEFEMILGWADEGRRLGGQTNADIPDDAAKARGLGADGIGLARTAVQYKIGTMIELPQAAVTADEIANPAKCFSFGTTDLTQTTFGFSRDDIEGKFLARYLDRKIMASNPFETIDAGAGRFYENACQKAVDIIEPLSLDGLFESHWLTLGGLAYACIRARAEEPAVGVR